MTDRLSADQLASFEPVSRSLKIDGYSTSVRLERVFWNVLDRMARDRGTTTGGLVADLYRDVFTPNKDLRNFASVLRVLCVNEVTSELGMSHAAVPRRTGAPA